MNFANRTPVFTDLSYVHPTAESPLWSWSYLKLRVRLGGLRRSALRPFP